MESMSLLHKSNQGHVYVITYLIFKQCLLCLNISLLKETANLQIELATEFKIILESVCYLCWPDELFFFF